MLNATSMASKGGVHRVDPRAEADMAGGDPIV
jgi:hypothetical protein